MDRGHHALVFTVLLVVATVPAAGSAPAATGADGPTLTRTTTLSLTPTTPGEIDVTVQFTVPDSISEITTRLPDRVQAVTSASFTNVGNTTWRWQRGNGTNPTLSFSLVVNETGAGQTLGAQGTYLFVDVGAWALVEVPRMPVQWLRSGPPINFEGVVEIAGDGATGGEMAYLGAVIEYTRTAHDQTFRLVVPAAADLVEPPAAVLNSLSAASDSLRVGERDDEVFVIAAPASIDWGARGLAGGSDAWVVADEQLDTPGNAWLHEYLHTRQAFFTTPTTRWLTEATATYYAALLTLEQDRISYEAFREHLSRGNNQPYAGAILADPRTWPAGANYLKGTLVWGAFDYRLRAATDSQHSAADVFSRLNADEGEVTGSEFLEMVEAVGGEQAREFMRYYTTEPEAPDTWSKQQHQRVFDVEPPRMVVSFVADAYRVTGPYRNRSTLPATLVVGETLIVTAAISNAGEVTGTFEPTLTVDGRPVATHSVTVAPEETVRITLSHTVANPGMQTIAVGPATVEIRVAEPATPTVTNLSVNQTRISPGEPVRLTFTAENRAAWPGGPLTVSVDGDPVKTITVPLLPNESTRAAVTITLEDTGTHEITVGNNSVSVTVASPPTQPGFGLVTTTVAVVVAMGGYLFYRRHSG